VRAWTTVRIVAEGLGVLLISEPGLREANIGEAEGLFWPEVKSRFGETLTERWFTDDDAAFPGGETAFETRSRGFAVLRRFVAEQPYRRIGVSTHGAMVRQLIKHALPPGSPRQDAQYGVMYIAISGRLRAARHPRRRKDQLIGNIDKTSRCQRASRRGGPRSCPRAVAFPRERAVVDISSAFLASNTHLGEGGFLPIDGHPAATRLPGHLKRLEAESIGIMREVVAEFRAPVMLYSIGKDSSVMLHLARKAFFPGKPPFPLLHIDTGWKFREMIAFRDETARRLGLDLIVHTNEEGRARGINPITSGSALHTAVMKTEALKQALDHHGFDAAFGGARRDEEKSRAKERVFSLRSAGHGWNPKNQRPELWRLYNTRLCQGESMRVFPLSNWTELDVWEYIAAEQIPVVPLYFAKRRPVVKRQGVLIMVDDDRLPLQPGEQPEMRLVRFRTLGCYPLTGAIESAAATPSDIVEELRQSRRSERQGRLIDNDEEAAMERKKREGYF